MSSPATAGLGPASLEEELAFFLSGTAARRERGLATIRNLGRRADLDALLAVLGRQHLVALLGTRLEQALPGEMPDTFRRAVSDQLDRARRRGTLFAHVTSDVCEALHSTGIDVVSIKGVGMAERLYGDPGLRSSQSDIDLLLAPEQLQHAVRILTARGCRVMDNVDWGSGLPHYHSSLVVARPVEARIELHWRLHWYERRLAQEMISRSVSDGSNVRILEPGDEFVSLLLTYARDGHHGLRIAADIAAWWDRYGENLPNFALDPLIERHPRLRNPLLSAVDVLGGVVGLPARHLVSPGTCRPRRVRIATRLASWSARIEQPDYSTNVTLSDLLLSPPSALPTFVRHYYWQPMGHYLLEYGWDPANRARNQLRRTYHAIGRLARCAVIYSRRLWQIRGGRRWELPPGVAATASTAPAPAGKQRLLVISPVRNEADHIERVVRSVAAQTRPPDLWIVADDGSDDGTLEILRALEAEVPFLRVVQNPPANARAKDRLAEALEAKAFNRALAQVDNEPFTHIGKLDGDVELPFDYFERLLAQTASTPAVGICGGSIIEPALGRGWRRVTAPRSHVHGALKLYTRECFEAVGGVQERLGWDTIDETYARMYGFETQRDLELVARHHRPGGSADGKLRGRMRHGQCAYIARHSPLWVLARSLKIGAQWDPRGLSGLAFLWGYMRSWFRRAERVEDEAFKRFVRAEHRLRAWRALRPHRRELTHA